MSIKVSIDASGGDFGFPVTVNASIKALNSFNDLYINLVGDEKKITLHLNKNNLNQSLLNRIDVTHSTEVIHMDDSASTALRHKKDSSMRVAINLVKNGKADACVSAGNTGALMSISRFVLKTIDGVDRPAIMSAVPTLTGPTHVLDLGANVDSKPETLLQFAIMGSIAVQNTEKIDNPSVGLLNVGTEELKGNDKSQETAELLKKSSLNYIGFVEGDDIYKGKVDVIVCDGFEGNIALKASEGVAHMFSHFINGK